MLRDIKAIVSFPANEMSVADAACSGRKRTSASKSLVSEKLVAVTKVVRIKRKSMVGRKWNAIIEASHSYSTPFSADAVTVPMCCIKSHVEYLQRYETI